MDIRGWEESEAKVFLLLSCLQVVSQTTAVCPLGPPLVSRSCLSESAIVLASAGWPHTLVTSPLPLVP